MKENYKSKQRFSSDRKTHPYTSIHCYAKIIFHSYFPTVINEFIEIWCSLLVFQLRRLHNNFERSVEVNGRDPT